ncbi:rhomboid family intramembrane serine protease [Lactobacillus delbrueckii subsp. bulgaricus]|nr:rhomboid family intramembrane serine protease [Lactobacillus delbrueckii subsp. bulgaricus]MBT8814306.1 rhomboid family intramembrane serine protease [Lactobacillus delbrueckii subsp. bulgaricus]
MNNLRRNYMTTALVVVLFAVFLVETFMGGSESTSVLLKMGAMFNPAVVMEGQWWRLFTAQFLHIGIMHIASNAIMIYYIGQYAEPVFGPWRFLLIYLLSGVGGSLLTLAFGNDQAISAGASTALFGLFGAMTCAGFKDKDNTLLSFLGRQALALAVINLVLDVFMPDVDILGHVGGLITGALLAVILGDATYKGYGKGGQLLAAAGLIVYVVLILRLGMVVTV